jgi:hypothetical protein
VQAKALVLAEVKVAQLRPSSRRAEAERDELRKRYKPRLQPSTEKKDAGKDVLQAIGRRLLIRCTSFLSGEYFSLKDYRLAGHPITAGDGGVHIQPATRASAGAGSDLRGPRRPDAVEPTST